MIKKIKKWSGDIQVVGTALLMLIAGSTFALDFRYLTLTGYDAGIVQQLQREISLLKHELLYVTNDNDKRRIQGAILIKEQHIKEVGK